MTDASGRAVGVLGAACGVMLLAATEKALSAVAGHHPDPTEVLVGRVLGGRHLGQGLAIMVAPGLARTGALVDVVHAASMLGLAGFSARHRREALSSAGVAGALAFAELLAGRRSAP